MEYPKYSKSDFDRLGHDSPEAKSLAEQLQDDVMQALHQAVRPIFQGIAARLDVLGHHLTVYYEAPGDIAYRDMSGPEECKLRLGCDVVISAGYRHLSSPEELPDL